MSAFRPPAVNRHMRLLRGWGVGGDTRGRAIRRLIPGQTIGK
jgi:hypothetical protein